MMIACSNNSLDIFEFVALVTEIYLEHWRANGGSDEDHPTETGLLQVTESDAVVVARDHPVIDVLECRVV